MSFVRLHSMVEQNLLLNGNRRMVTGKFSDSRGVPYEVRDGVVYRVRKEKKSPYKS